MPTDLRQRLAAAAAGSDPLATAALAAAEALQCSLEKPAWHFHDSQRLATLLVSPPRAGGQRRVRLRGQPEPPYADFFAWAGQQPAAARGGGGG